MTLVVPTTPIECVPSILNQLFNDLRANSRRRWEWSTAAKERTIGERMKRPQTLLEAPRTVCGVPLSLIYRGTLYIRRPDACIEEYESFSLEDCSIESRVFVWQRRNWVRQRLEFGWRARARMRARVYQSIRLAIPKRKKSKKGEWKGKTCSDRWAHWPLMFHKK